MTLMQDNSITEHNWKNQLLLTEYNTKTHYRLTVIHHAAWAQNPDCL